MECLRRVRTRAFPHEKPNRLYSRHVSNRQKLGALDLRFEAGGYGCSAPNWPLHEGEPAQLRAETPPGLRALPLERLVDSFHQNFGSCMSRTDGDAAWAVYAMNENRNVLRDAMGKAGRIKLKQPHAPLVFIAGDDDEIFPDKLDANAAKACAREGSVVEFKEFPDRGHYICSQPGREEVADCVEASIERVVPQNEAAQVA